MAIYVGSAVSSFLTSNSAAAFGQGTGVGIGTTDTTGRDAGIGTATGTLIFNATDSVVQVFNGTDWDVLSNT